MWKLGIMLVAISAIAVIPDGLQLSCLHLTPLALPSSPSISPFYPFNPSRKSILSTHSSPTIPDDKFILLSGHSATPPTTHRHRGHISLHQAYDLPTHFIRRIGSLHQSTPGAQAKSIPLDYPPIHSTIKQDVFTDLSQT